MPTSTCTIESAEHQDGLWLIRAVVVTPQGTRSASYHFDGDADMTDADLVAMVLGFYE